MKSPADVRQEAEVRSRSIATTYQTLRKVFRAPRGFGSEALDQEDRPAETQDSTKCLAEYAGSPSSRL